MGMAFKCERSLCYLFALIGQQERIMSHPLNVHSEVARR